MLDTVRTSHFKAWCVNTISIRWSKPNECVTESNYTVKHTAFVKKVFQQNRLLKQYQNKWWHLWTVGKSFTEARKQRNIKRTQLLHKIFKNANM